MKINYEQELSKIPSHSQSISLRCASSTTNSTAHGRRLDAGQFTIKAFNIRIPFSYWLFLSYGQQLLLGVQLILPNGFQRIFVYAPYDSCRFHVAVRFVCAFLPFINHQAFSRVSFYFFFLLYF